MHRLVLILCLGLASFIPVQAKDLNNPGIYSCLNDNRVVYFLMNDLSFTMVDHAGVRLRQGVFTLNRTAAGKLYMFILFTDADVTLEPEGEGGGNVPWRLRIVYPKNKSIEEFRCRWTEVR